MILYFDTNVYDLLVKQAETETSALNGYLRRQGHIVLVSLDNIGETARISQAEKRQQQYGVIRIIGRKLCSPFSYLQAEEVRHEIERCRPQWLVPLPKVGNIESLLRDQKRIWKMLQKKGTLDKLDWSVPIEALKRVIASSVHLSKTLRKVQLNSESLKFKGPDPTMQALIDSLPYAEQWWRMESQGVWWEALHGALTTRDYCDWLLPYVRIEDILPEDWLYFWLRDVSADAVPRNRIQGLAHHYQTLFPIKAGNVMDTNHAAYLLECDAFFTRDNDFFGVLTKVISDMKIKVAMPFLLDERQSVVDGINEALNSRAPRSTQ